MKIILKTEILAKIKACLEGDRIVLNYFSAKERGVDFIYVEKEYSTEMKRMRLESLLQMMTLNSLKKFSPNTICLIIWG